MAEIGNRVDGSGIVFAAAVVVGSGIDVGSYAGELGLGKEELVVVIGGNGGVGIV